MTVSGFARVRGVGVVCAVLAGCTNASGQQPLSVLEQRVVAAGNRFGLELFSQLVSSAPGENVFISPTSISTCLAMAYNGAAGTTDSAMARTLRLGGMRADSVSRANSVLMQDLLGADAEVKLKIANSLWARDGIRFNESFLSANRQHFNALVSTLDFTSPSAVRTINDWVSDNTNHLIPTIIDGIDPLNTLILVNAIYFKGAWAKPFSKDTTRTQDFFLLDGTTTKRNMMRQSGSYEYYAAKEFQALRLPYGTGRLAMYLFVPKENAGLPDFLEQLTPTNWGKWLAGFHESYGNVTLPKFKLDYKEDLNDALNAMGMAIAFQPGKADFSKMLTDRMPFWLSTVRHKTYVEVSEVGTEAAAVTATVVDGGWLSPSRPRPFTIVANHPFFCAIVDRKTGAILFMGAIYDPKQ